MKDGPSNHRRGHAWSPELAIVILAIAFVSRGFATTGPVPTSSCCAKELTASSVISDRSLYQLDSSWTNDTGGILKLASLAGRPQVVTMFFANCQFACPVLVHDMKKIEAALPENL